MKAKVGDWLVMKGTTTERHDQRGLITEVDTRKPNSDARH